MIARLRLLLALLGALSVLNSASAAPPDVAAATPGTNLLQPLSSTQKWQFLTIGGAKARVTREKDTLTVTTTAVDGTDYHVQLFYLAPKLQEGAAYTLSLRAKADAPRKMHVYALIRGGDYHGIGLLNDAAVGTEFKTFTYTFAVKDVGQAVPLCPQFLFGNAPGRVTLSDVSLKQADPGTAVTPTPAPRFWWLQRFDPAEALLTTEGTAQVATISKTDGEPWHVQLGWFNASVTDGAPLLVKFRARADVPRDMMLLGGISDGDYHPICDQQYVALSTSWRDYAIRIIPHGSAGHPVGFPQFLLGKRTGTVWIDQVVVTSPDAPASDPATPAADPVVYAPQAGELRAEGIIQAAGFGPDGFTLLVSRLVRPDGTAIPLSPARPKPVRLTADTQFRSLADGSQLYLATLKPGDTVSIIGPDLGMGKSLPARLMLR